MKNLLTLTITCLIATSIWSQDNVINLDYYLPTDVNYNPAIPTPKEVIGYEVGAWHVTHDQLLFYMRTLAQASDRIHIEERGASVENRALPLLIITSPENQRNLKNIQKNHIARIEGGATTIAISASPIVVYQGLTIHGNEPSGSNAGLVAAYYLAAAEGPKINELLSNTVILLDPCMNPDGLQRFATWVNQHKSMIINPDNNDREYDEVWPGGRTNHYWFDLNRDWLAAQLPESKVRIKTFHEWYPNILTDHHEMGTNSTYFFQPGIPSRTHPLTPNKNQQLTEAIGNYHAKALDKIGSFYYTQENFDDFYYGKGSTFPDINGGIGILFEQGSSRGHAQESENGIVTFPFTIKNQFTTLLSTLDAAVGMREEILNYQNSFYKNARNEASKANGVLVFGDEKDAAKTYHMAQMLKRHKIKIYELKQDYTSKGKTFKKGYAYVIPKNQRQYRLINSMFEKRTQFEDSLFYDVSAWTLPLTFNVDYEESGMQRAGNEITELLPPKGIATGANAYAYVMEWHEYYTPKVIYQSQQHDIRTKFAMEPFQLEGKSYDYGTILIPVQNQSLNATDLFALLQELAANSHVNITGVRTGLTEGIDLGSNLFNPIPKQKVAVLVGEGINPYDAGEVWHLLDTRYQMHITKLDVNSITQTNISKYTDIILPATWGSGPNKQATARIKKWIESGGTLIAYRNSGRWLDRNELMNITFKRRRDTATGISFKDRRNYNGAQVIGGAIFEAKIDRSHPITFGYKNENLPLFRNTTLFVKPDKDSYDNPVQYTNNPLLSGYISEENLQLLKNTVPVKIGGKGRGTIIYFTDNTNFRAFWYGTNKLLANAIFFGEEM